MARKQKTIHYIYKTTCLITGRYYVGMHSTCNIDDGYMGSGKRLRYSIRKHGKNNHTKEILEYCETRELLIEAEKMAITPDMITDRNCMNMKEGGTGGLLGLSEEIRNKIKAGAAKWLVTQWCDEEYRKNRTNESAARMTAHHKNGKIKYDTFTGKQHSDETKKVISQKASQRTGNKNSSYGTCWITKDGLNKKIKKEDLETYVNEGWIKGRK